MRTFLAALLILLFASCSIEKRRYNSGFYVEWFGKENPEKHFSPVASLQSIKVNSVELPDIKLFLKERTYASQKNIPSNKNKYAGHTKPISVFDKKSKINIEDEPDIHGANGMGIVLGVVFIVGGILCGVFLAWWLAAILIPLGIICIVSAANTISKNSELKREYRENQKENKKSAEKSNVVYLKNGSMIRGEILEMNPNDSVKIQTSDGSIFVYKMDEVLKITREERKK